jgi:citrate lyase beta subunit
LNRGFSPSPGEVDEARRLVELYRAAESEGAAAFRTDDRIADLSTLKQAVALLAYAEACTAHDEAKPQVARAAAS